MIVHMVWPHCEYQNGSWGNKPIDSFWVECTPSETESQIVPRLSSRELLRLDELRHRHEDQYPGTSANSIQLYGHMLPAEGAEQGWNFITPAIFSAVKQRTARKVGVVERFRLLHNMLASQAMCFNLFGQLVEEPEGATALVRAIVPGEVDRVTRIAIEHAPEPAREYLGDRTAFDAFVEYIRPGGRLAFVGIETKLTEPFSPKRYDGERYRELTQQVGSPWLPDAWPAVADKAHNQLWRDHLLVQAMLRHPGAPYAAGRLMLVRHPQDAVCATVVAGYRALLQPGDDTFTDLPLDLLVAAWKSTVPSDHTQWLAWLSDIEERYLRLEDSEADWRHWETRRNGAKAEET